MNKCVCKNNSDKNLSSCSCNCGAMFNLCLTCFYVYVQSPSTFSDEYCNHYSINIT